MTVLHFQPICGKSLDIIRAILQTEEIASAGNVFADIHLATEELVVNIVDNAYPDGGNAAVSETQGDAIFAAHDFNIEIVIPTIRIGIVNANSTIS